VDGTSAIKLYNQKYWTVENMEACNWATNYGTRWGIHISADDGKIKHGFKIAGNTVRDVYASPVRASKKDAAFPSFYDVGGIYLKVTGAGRADGVLIDGNQVTNIIGVGISFWGQGEDGKTFVMNYDNCSPHVVVRNNTVSRTADGILIYGTDDELVEHNLVEYAGSLGVAGNPGVGTEYIAGLWPTRHVNGLWQFNQVHHTAKWRGDNQGFDNDCYVKGATIFQYNFSHDNAGGFFLDCIDMDHNQADKGQTIARYNISMNDKMLAVFTRGKCLVLHKYGFYAPGAQLACSYMALAKVKQKKLFINNIFLCRAALRVRALLQPHRLLRRCSGRAGR